MSAAVLYIVLMPCLIGWMHRYGSFIPVFILVALPRVFNFEFLGGLNPYSFILALAAGAIFARNDVFHRIDVMWSSGGTAGSLIRLILSVLILFFSIYAFGKFNIQNFWEINYTLIPLALIIFVRQYCLRLPVVSAVLELLGKHSMNIWLIHPFIRSILFADWTYSFRYFWLIPAVLISVSLLLSIVIEKLKALIQYDDLMESIWNCIYKFD